MFDLTAHLIHQQRAMDFMNAFESDRAAAALQFRIESRLSLQGLGLTDSQMERFQEVLRGIDRRYADVMARRTLSD